MSIFDIEKDDLLRLTDRQLEELIARLAEAEVASQGHSPAWVNWSGPITAPDGKIDIDVQIPVDALRTGFLARPHTIFQSKTSSMPNGKIQTEMCSGGNLSDTISALASKGGSYIIVSLKDDCSPIMKKERLEAMKVAVKDDPYSNRIHLDFYDRSKLTQWLRQHPAVLLWVKEKLGQGYSGWQPYGAWSNPPHGVEDTLIAAPGVTITLPQGKGLKLSIQDAIAPMRELIRSTKKAIRITGLSGVGKTRIVQALFDKTVAAEALDHTVAVYVDTGATPSPSASAMLGRLIAEGRRAIMVLDNCPSDLHSVLASQVAATSNEVSLITVEYDIKEDNPQTTEVIHIEAVGPEIAELLVNRRFPGIGQLNAQRIADFSGGNTRVSLAIAERVEEGESLAQLTDAQLFNRLFDQRNHTNDDLRAQAEILALVYSFSDSSSEGDPTELEILGSIAGFSEMQLHRSIKLLHDRHIVQKRSHWRALLPQAIANKLATSSLNSIPIKSLKAIFEAPGHERLLMSFAHRLGLLHDHPVAQKIVESWLQPDGLLGAVLTLNDMELRMLNYVGPVAPDALLDRVEAELNASKFVEMNPGFTPSQTILNLLQSLAYEPNAFTRCLRLLIQVTDYEDTSNNSNPDQERITRFFQPYLSGTHASLEQRIVIMRECLLSNDAGRRSLGCKMLAAALSGPTWIGSALFDFGARPRDFGLQPNHNEFVDWRSAFIRIAVQFGTCGDPDLEGPARLTLANRFRFLWRQEAIRGKLVDAARKLHTHKPWVDGWRAVRTTIYVHYTHPNNNEIPPANLVELEIALKPNDLIPRIMAYVLSVGNDSWALDADSEDSPNEQFLKNTAQLEDKALELGKDFAASNHKLSALGHQLFSNGSMHYRVAFGRGLAKGATSRIVGWQQLVDELERQPEGEKNLAVFAGFIEETNDVDPVLAQEILDQCAKHSMLRLALIGLHPGRQFTETDLDRCIAILDDPSTPAQVYESILCRKQYIDLPEVRIIDLAQRLLGKPEGDRVVLNALSMRLHAKDRAVDALGLALRQVGLSAAIQMFERVNRDFGGSEDYHMECVVGEALRLDGNETEKLEWLDAIFAVVDRHDGYIPAFQGVIGITASLMQKEFLKRVVEGTEEEQSRRQFFVSQGGFNGAYLAKIPMDDLIEWCRARDNSRVWATVAAGISIWSESGEQGEATLLESAIRLLEASPDPEVVLHAFSEHVTPSAWSGSRVRAMQPRADAISSLVNHQNPEIAKAAKSVSAMVAQWIDAEKRRDEKEDEEREQRFE